MTTAEAAGISIDSRDHVIDIAQHLIANYEWDFRRTGGQRGDLTGHYLDIDSDQVLCALLRHRQDDITLMCGEESDTWMLGMPSMSVLASPRGKAAGTVGELCESLGDTWDLAADGWLESVRTKAELEGECKRLDWLTWYTRKLDPAWGWGDVSAADAKIMRANMAQVEEQYPEETKLIRDGKDWHCYAERLAAIRWVLGDESKENRDT